MVTRLCSWSNILSKTARQAAGMGNALWLTVHLPARQEAVQQADERERKRKQDAAKVQVW